MLVSDYMSSDPVTIQVGDTVRTAFEKMKEVGGRRLPVINEEGRLIGIITDRDLRLALDSPVVAIDSWRDMKILDKTLDEKIDSIVHSPVVTILPDEGLEKAGQLFLEKHINGLPVVDENHLLVGIITTSDLIRALIDTL